MAEQLFSFRSSPSAGSLQIVAVLRLISTGGRCSGGGVRTVGSSGCILQLPLTITLQGVPVPGSVFVTEILARGVERLHVIG